MIHQSHPSHYVSFDRTMQDIVYKLVPGMQTEEIARRDLFHQKSRTNENEVGCSVPEASAKEEEIVDDECCTSSHDPCSTHHRKDEPVLIQLVPDDKLESIERPYISLSVFVTVNTLKRLLSYMLFSNLTKYNEFDIFCNNELMGRDYSMAFIQKTRWRNRSEPIVLVYKQHLDF